MLERCEFCQREVPYLNEVHLDGGAYFICDLCKAMEETTEEAET